MVGRFEQFVRRDLWEADIASLSTLPRLCAIVVRLLVAVGRELSDSLFSARVGALVYTTLLSLVPFLAVTFSVLKAFGGHLEVAPLLAQVLEPLGPAGQEITGRIITFIGNLRVGVLGAVGVAGLFLTTYFLIDQVESSLNAIWRVAQGRPWTRKFTDYLSVILVGPVLVFTAFALIAAAQSHWLVQRILEIQTLGYVVVWTAKFMPFVLLCTLFIFFYKVVPYTKVRFTAACVGGVTAAILWDIAGAAFAVFVASSARYSAIYSGFAILIFFLLWLYVSWYIVLIGAQVAYFQQHPSAYLAPAIRRWDTHAFRERLAVHLLLSITRRYSAGDPPYKPDDLATQLNVPASLVATVLADFVQAGILGRVIEPVGIVLVKAPEAVLMKEVLDVIKGASLGVAGATAEAVEAVDDLFSRLDQTVGEALAGVTLKAFALQTELRAPEPSSADLRLEQEASASYKTSPQ